MQRLARCSHFSTISIAYPTRAKAARFRLRLGVDFAVIPAGRPRDIRRRAGGQRRVAADVMTTGYCKKADRPERETKIMRRSRRGARDNRVASLGTRRPGSHDGDPVRDEKVLESAWSCGPRRRSVPFPPKSRLQLFPGEKSGEGVGLVPPTAKTACDPEQTPLLFGDKQRRFQFASHFPCPARPGHGWFQHFARRWV
jgi:hypothetical protein